MDEEFRAAASEKISRLLQRWRIVEQSIKEAEQISSEVQIPAINELRYASRQLINAVIYFEKPVLSTDEKEKIDKRIIVADQYLYNAEHDIADAVITFYHRVVDDVEERFGRNIITSHFPQFPQFRQYVKECELLIADSRGNYELRGNNYHTIRTNHIPHLLEMHERLIDAQVSAEEERQRTEHAITIAQSRTKSVERFSKYLGVLAVVLAAVAIVEGVALWKYTPTDYCKEYGKTPILKILCSSP